MLKGCISFDNAELKLKHKYYGNTLFLAKNALTLGNALFY